jgi:hypothetical protein
MSTLSSPFLALSAIAAWLASWQHFLAAFVTAVIATVAPADVTFLTWDHGESSWGFRQGRGAGDQERHGGDDGRVLHGDGLDELEVNHC